MARLSTLLKTAGLGAGLMYFFDPDRGRQRRAWLEDKIKHLTNEMVDGVDSTMRDLSNRMQGMAAEFSSAAGQNPRQRGQSSGRQSSRQQGGDQSQRQGGNRFQSEQGQQNSDRGPTCAISPGSQSSGEEFSGQNRPPVESQATSQSPSGERAESESQWNEATTQK